MTTDRKHHPWNLNGAAVLANIDPGGERRSPGQASRENAAATKARMLLDDHRSDGGRCVRCDAAWPCSVAADAMYGSAS
ncbi:hypothetical protein [Kitasatospora sp. NPDC093558]|uniref:hypothetical protein n=1 Tax=Kitasatospora sp. NPDC093558 TaxID=3155201 RepID=UPI0034127740